MPVTVGLNDHVSAEIQACCAALGYNDGAKYHINSDTLGILPPMHFEKPLFFAESVKDLIRYLRRDSENHDMRLLIGSMTVVRQDLVPILVHYSEPAGELFDVVVRLLVNLTNPPMLLYEGALPEGQEGRHIYLELSAQLGLTKEAFVNETVWVALAKRLGTILNAVSFCFSVL